MQGGPTAIAVDAQNVYWVDTGDPTAGAVEKFPKNGTSPVTVATGQAIAPAIALDATNVYYASSSAVFGVPITGAAPFMLGASAGYPLNMTAHGGLLYVHWFYGSGDSGASLKVFRPTPPALVADLRVSDPTDPPEPPPATTIAVDDADAYVPNAVSAGGGILRVPLSNGPSAGVVFTGSAVGDLVIDATTLYFANAAAVMSVPLTGGMATTLTPRRASSPLAADATNVYFASPTDVQRIPKGGGVSTTVARGQNPTAFAIDDTHVYWTDASAGSVFRAPK
jgi:hypothetical protein